jgi:hypothetical protein
VTFLESICPRDRRPNQQELVELDLKLKVNEEAFWLAAILDDRSSGSCSEILIVGVGLAEGEVVAFLVPIVLLKIPVTVRMRAY